MKKKQALLIDGLVEIRFDFDWEILELVKSIPRRRFRDNKKGKYWVCPLSVDNLSILQDADFVMDKGLLQYLDDKNKKKDAVIEMPDLKKELFPFQRDGVSFIYQRDGRAIVADEMGLGKTIQALAYLSLCPEKRPAVIVCPGHLKLNWLKEIKETLPDEMSKNIEVLYGLTATKINPKTEIIIVNYHILNAWVNELIKIKPQIVIMDEAHFCKNNKTQRTKAAKKLTKKSPYLIALTGTPIVNKPVEGFNIIQMVDKTVFPNRWDYLHRYCDAKHNGFGWDFTGASNEGELHKKLKTVMIRRLKKDVLKDLPDKIYSSVPIEIQNIDEYKKAEDDFIDYLLRKKGIQAAQKASRAGHLAKIEGLKQLAVDGKIQPAMKWIEDFLENNVDGKLVVFGTHRKTVDVIMDKFDGIAVKVDGSVSTKDRDLAVGRFHEDKNIRLFMGNIQAAGTGLTLTAASTVAFLELPWSPGELAQAEDRCHRIGQKNFVNVYHLIAADTIEEKIAMLLDKKRKVLDAVLDGEQDEGTPLLTELIKMYRKEGR